MLDNYTNHINQLEYVDQLPISPTNTSVFLEDSSLPPVATVFTPSLTENTIHIIIDPQTAFILELLHDITFVILTLVLSKIIFWILNKFQKYRFWKKTLKSYEQKAIESNDVQAMSSSNENKKEEEDERTGTSSSNDLGAEIVSSNVKFYIDEDDHWVPDDIVNKIDNNRVNNIIVRSNSHANNSDVAAAEKMKFVIAGFERTLNRKHLFVFFCALLLFFFFLSLTHVLLILDTSLIMCCIVYHM